MVFIVVPLFDENLCENVVGEAESGLERLHACAEKELQGYFDEEISGDSEQFIAFRCKLAGLTRYLSGQCLYYRQSCT